MALHLVKVAKSIDPGAVVAATPEVMADIESPPPRRPWRIGGECTKETAVVWASSPLEAMTDAAERWPDGDPW